MIRSITKIAASVLITLFSLRADAQQTGKKPFDTRINVLFGLNQPLLLKGFNIEGNVLYKRLAFDFSHGVSLDFTGRGVTGEVSRQHLVVHMPYSTGLGIGYRFTEAFNVRVEPKWHQFEIYYDGDAQTAANRITRYNTFSLGLGAYYNWLPFKNKVNGLRGIMIAPSIRFWPTLSSTLDNDRIVYNNRFTGRQETHKRMEPGVSNTPLVFNISVGYSFAVKKRK